ncbi:MAG TPA: FISUMP domain-containing protein [Bacteroidales bacterium]|nr:FISUMP domain-containing protein [Bacteroidales bacterium]HSA42368.1 FISUMP domain-containing protein [Bacteroidales bacterium]
MKKVCLFIWLSIVFIFNVLAQKPTMLLSFTASNGTNYEMLDSIKVINRSGSGDTVMQWPDTVMSLSWQGLHEAYNGSDQFGIYSSYPNPSAYFTTITLFIPKRGTGKISVVPLLGNQTAVDEKVMEPGYHTYRFSTPGPGVFLITAHWAGRNSCTKCLQTGTSGLANPSLEYIAYEPANHNQKAAGNIQTFQFLPGDTLLYVGYAGGSQSGITDNPAGSKNYTFQFATNLPCIGNATVQYAGQVYNTIQVFSQCWLKENLNVGTMIPGTQAQTDNGTIEKYCYVNSPDSCAKYGGLYQWNEMMQYMLQPGTQGICPPGWRIPTDDDWKILEGAVDSQFGIGDPEWDATWSRGFDAGSNLKTSTGWITGNGTNLYGFSGLPAGERFDAGTFIEVGEFSYWWSSNQADSTFAWYRYIFSDPVIYRSSFSKKDGYSVRCLKN